MAWSGNTSNSRRDGPKRYAQVRASAQDQNLPRQWHRCMTKSIRINACLLQECKPTMDMFDAGLRLQMGQAELALFAWAHRKADGDELCGRSTAGAAVTFYR